MTIFYLPHECIAFPDPAEADSDGLLAVGGDLAPPRLIAAYARGIFPWYSKDTPILWWSPDPRLVLEPGNIHIPKRLARILRQGRFQVTFDTAFERVMRFCASVPRPQGDGTWILEEMVQAYIALHHAGFAHSVETWVDGELAGGLYGVALGRAFFGESMFFIEPNASKVAFATLVGLLHQWGFSLIDCQQTTPHMQRFGATEWPRADFLERLEEAIMEPAPRQGRAGSWRQFSPGESPA